MHLRVVDEIFSYTQNIGSHEDIVTAALATAFCYCPNFTEKFFCNIGIKNFKWKEKKDYNYFIDTGWEINGNYSWLTNKTKFRPDILISKKEIWDEKKPPKDEQLIIVESKIWARFGPNQRKKYHEFEKEYLKKVNKNITTLLIAMKEEDFEDIYKFDLSITWNKLIHKFEEIYTEIPEWNSESVILRELIDFIKIRLFPDKESFKNEDEKYCPKIILQKMKYRISGFSGRILIPYKIKNNSTISDQCRKLIKLYNLNDNDLMSAIRIKGENKVRNICCAAKEDVVLFWVTDQFTNKKKEEECKKIGTIKLYSEHWYDEWFDIMTKVYRLVNG